MSARTGNPRITITADASSVDRELEQAGKKVGLFGKQVEEAGSHMKTHLAGLAAGVTSVVGAVETVKSSVETVENLATATAKLSRTTGLDSKAASAWAETAKVRNISADQLNRTFVTLAKNMKAATDGGVKSAAQVRDLEVKQKRLNTQLEAAKKAGDSKQVVTLTQRMQDLGHRIEVTSNSAGKQAKAFNMLGVSQADLKKGDTSQILAKMADGFAAMKDGPEKAALAQQLFGRQSQTLLPLLNKGSDALKEQLGLVDKYGASLSGKTVEQVKKSAAAQREATIAMDGFKVMLGTKVLPVVDQAIEFFAKVATGLHGVGNTTNQVKGYIGTLRDTVSAWVAKNRTDVNSVFAAFTKFGAGVKQVFEEVFLPIIKRDVAAAVKILGDVADVVRGIVRLVSGLLSGDWDKAWSGAKEAVGGATRGIVTAVKAQATDIFDVIKGLGPKLVHGIVTGLANMGSAIATGIVAGIKDAARAVPGLAADALHGIGHAITSGISKGFGKLNPFGDGLGQPSLPSGGLAGGNGLMGASSLLSPFASMAGRFGLHTTSGLRPGAITVSGNRSYHADGYAIDEAGTPAGMLGYFRYLKSKYGAMLRELIYTPGGVGIKDGKPFQYTGAVAAEHNDHVHVAFTGAGGTGDGYGQIENLWTRAGGDPNAQAMAAAIAMAESSGREDAKNVNTDGSIDRGLWQINSTHGALSTFNPLANARAAVSISNNGRNWGPWTTYVSGAYKQFLSAARSAIGTGGSAGGGSDSVSRTGKSTGVFNPGIPPAYTTGGYSDSSDSTLPAGVVYKNGQIGYLWPGSSKVQSIPFAQHLAAAGVPAKGLTVDQSTARQAILDAAPAAPTIQDYQNRDLAYAQLTPDTGDDLSVYQRMLATARGKLGYDINTGNVTGETQDIQDIKNLQDSIDQLTTATNQATALQQQRDALNQEIADNQKKILALAAQGPQIVAAVVAAVSGGIGGQVGLGFATPGYAGGVANYGAGGL